MAAVWFVLTVPTEQQQQKAKAQDKAKEKVEIVNESKVTFQTPTRAGLNDAFNNQPDQVLTGELFISTASLKSVTRESICIKSIDLLHFVR